MKAIFAGTILAAACVTATSATAQEASHAASIEMQLAGDIIANGFPPETRLEMFDATIEQMLAQMRASLPQLGQDPKLDAAFDRHVSRVRETAMQVLAGHVDPIMDSLVVAYADEFTEAELRGLHGFIMSPEGRGFLSRTAEVNGHPAFAAANQAYMTEYLSHMPDLMQQLRADVERVQGSAE